MALSVISELSVAFVATLGATKVMFGASWRMASSGLALLLGPLELEYLLCRCCLLFGLVAMLCALGTRAVLQVGLSRAHTPGEQRAGLAVAAIFGGFALALLGYADSTSPGLLRPEAEFVGGGQEGGRGGERERCDVVSFRDGEMENGEMEEVEMEEERW